MGKREDSTACFQKLACPLTVHPTHDRHIVVILLKVRGRSDTIVAGGSALSLLFSMDSKSFRYLTQTHLQFFLMEAKLVLAVSGYLPT